MSMGTTGLLLPTHQNLTHITLTSIAPSLVHHIITFAGSALRFGLFFGFWPVKPSQRLLTLDGKVLALLRLG